MTRIDPSARPVPRDIITEDYTHDEEIGLLKSGKEADVFLVRRHGRERSCLLAAKRYRPVEHRAFRNDLRYRAHRRIDGFVRDGDRMRRRTFGRNVQKAMDRKSPFGRTVLSRHWIDAEYGALDAVWQSGAPVPYPVERLEDGILMQFVGAEDQAAPRLVDARVDRAALPDLFDQTRAGLLALTRAGIVHADLSPYNVLLWKARLWFIDLPQAVPILENDDATDLLHHDVMTMCAWFMRQGLEVDPEDLFVEMVNEAFELRMRDLFEARE